MHADCPTTTGHRLLTWGKPVTYACAQKRTKKGLNLKEEVGQRIFHCPTTSNNYNLDVYDLRQPVLR